MNPKVTIIIIHWKHVNDTLACLKSVKNCTYDNFDVSLVLNGSNYEDRISLNNTFKDWEKISLIENDENLGFAEGNNIAIRQALKYKQPDYILTLNNDTEVEPDFISKAVTKAQEGFDMVQCLMYEFLDKKKIDKAGLKLTLSGLTFDIKNLSDPAPLFCPSAGAALYSVKMLKAVAFDRQISSGFHSSIVKDYFDKDYFLYAEDFDLGFRALLQGYQAALAYESVVYHKGSASTSTMSDLAVYHTYRNLIFTYLKCYPKTWLFLYGPLILSGHLAILIKNLTRGQGQVVISAWRDAWKYRDRMKNKRKQIQSKIKISNKQLSKYRSKKLFS